MKFIGVDVSGYSKLTRAVGFGWCAYVQMLPQTVRKEEEHFLKISETIRQPHSQSPFQKETWKVPEIKLNLSVSGSKSKEWGTLECSQNIAEASHPTSWIRVMGTRKVTIAGRVSSPQSLAGHEGWGFLQFGLAKQKTLE